LRYRPSGKEPTDRRLSRFIPDDWTHVEKYPLSSVAAVALPPTPVVIGINWYSSFHNPIDEAGNYYRPGRRPVGHWWIGRGNLGGIRGGHCVALKPRGVRDNTPWWDFYDQGSEGACVGYGCSRIMTLMNRKRYFSRWLWDRAKETDEWSETNPGDNEGTSVNAGLRILFDRGHVAWSNKFAPLNSPAAWQHRGMLVPKLGDGVQRFRWITSIDDLLYVLGYQDKDYCDLLNSWGRAYPHLTRIPAATLERLWHEYGEMAVVVDR
jgi:hypothetical protein